VNAKQEFRQIDYGHLKVLAAAVQLDDIRLLDCQFSAILEPDGLSPDETLSFVRHTRGTRWSIGEDGRVLTTKLTFRVRGQAQRRNETGQALTTRDVFLLESSWKARYHFLKEVDLNNHELVEDFAFTNGQLNVFPYFRQLVSDLTSRSGWPTVVLPVFRAPSRRPVDSVKRDQ
jgi:hypothetical protein